MRFRDISLINLFVIALSFLMLGLPGARVDSQSRRLYQRNGNEGVIAGTVKFIGRPPPRKRIDLSADPVCARKNPGALMDDIVVRRGRLVNVFIYVKRSEVLDELSFETPANPVVLDQRGCQYVPHVFGLQVNQTLEVRNSDPTIHNVHEVPKNNPDWNQSQPINGRPLLSRFARSEIMIPIKCNQHPWMRALVGVLPHPFFAVSDMNGNFRIEGLPPGKYSIGVWHERFEEKVVDVTVVPRVTTRFDLRFDSRDDRYAPPRRQR